MKTVCGWLGREGGGGGWTIYIYTLYTCEPVKTVWVAREEGRGGREEGGLYIYTLYTCEPVKTVWVAREEGRGGGRRVVYISHCTHVSSLSPASLHRLADNLPAATVFRNLKTNELQYEDGFKLGFSHGSHIVINNHLNIVIKYHAITR